MIKNEQLKALNYEYTCQFSDKEIVLGEGSPDSELFLIGEAPGKDEVKLLKPFVGMAGKNLNEFLEILGVGRDAIYITNAIKYRLSKLSEKTGRISNRPALKADIEGSRHYLTREICTISPRIIVTLGNVPLRAVTGDYSLNIGTLHGRPSDVEIEGMQYKLFALYHPASIIYNRSLKDIYIEDIRKLSLLLQK
jgi:DNA polymerase